MSLPPLAVAVPPPDVFARACQAIVEQDFLHRCAVQLSCDYDEVERHFDCLNPNIVGLVNSPGGRALLAQALSTGDGLCLIPSLH